MQQNSDTVEGKAKILEEYPTFSNWRESWEHNYNKCAMAAKEADDSAILDFERAEEKYNQDLACYLRFVDPIDERKFLDRDLWRNRLYGVQSNELDGTKNKKKEIEKVKEYIAEGKVFI